VTILPEATAKRDAIVDRKRICDRTDFDEIEQALTNLDGQAVGRKNPPQPKVFVTHDLSMCQQLTGCEKNI